MTNLFKTMSGAMLLAFVLQTGCGSAAMQVRDPVGNNPADDVLTFQESLFGLVGTSNSAAEAADRVAKYCEKNGAAIGLAFSAMDQDPDSVVTASYLEKSEALLRRAEKSLGAKAEYMDTEEFAEAASGCRSLDDSGDAPADEPYEVEVGDDESDVDSLE